MERERHSHTRSNIAIAVLTAIVVVCIIGIIVSIRRSHTYMDAGITGTSMAGAYRHRNFDGEDYEYNNLVTTILYVGIDSEGPITINQVYAQAPRSDTLMLLVLDELNHKSTVIAFNRNTMTQMRQYDLSGNFVGNVELQLAYAYAEGEGGEVSCETVSDAISTILGGIPINYYAAMNRSAISGFNALAGGVTVTVPNDDLAGVDGTFTKGSTVILTDEQAETFVRSRDTDTAFSNTGRMERQQAYVTAYVQKVQDSLLADANGTWTKINDSDMRDYMVTNITRNQYIGLMNSMNKVDLANMTFYTPIGEHDNTGMYEEFNLDTDDLTRHIRDIFYTNQ